MRMQTQFRIRWCMGFGIAVGNVGGGWGIVLEIKLGSGPGRGVFPLPIFRTFLLCAVQS